MRRATKRLLERAGHGLISIHALHEESDDTPADIVTFFTISIHALHEESDLYTAYPVSARCISIHALHEESDRKGTDP